MPFFHLKKYLTLFFALLITSSLGAAVIKNGFDLKNSIIPADKILQGGPPKEGIPSIDQPKFITVNQADFLQADDSVLGITLNGIPRAYPIKILNWHEIVNDKIAGTPIVISYCPLCGTGMIYHAKVNGQILKFGVSGLLYNSDVLLYDRQSQTLWSQIMAKAISGKWVNTKLKTIPSTYTTWELWATQHPNTQVLSTQTGYQRDYNKSPYGDYETSRNTYFPITAESRRYHPKERVLGITIKGKSKSYPFVELANSGKTKIIDTFMGETLHIKFNTNKRTGTIKNKQGRELAVANSFWFAWYAFHPDTLVYSKN